MNISFSFKATPGQTYPHRLFLNELINIKKGMKDDSYLHFSMHNK